MKSISPSIITIKRTFLCFILVTLSISAFAKKSEHQRYEKLQDSWKYKAYAKASKKGLKPIVKKYNKYRKKEGKDPLPEAYVRALMGLTWSMAIKPRFAIAESDLVLDNTQESKHRYIAHSVMSIAMYEKGWRGLAREHSQIAKSLIDNGSLSKTYDKEKSIAFLVIGTLAMLEGDIDLTAESFQQIGEIHDKKWLPLLATGAAQFYSGKYISAIKTFKSLSKSENMSDSERQLVENLGAQIQSYKEGKSKDLKLSKVVSGLAYDSIVNNGGKSYRKLAKAMKKYRKKF